MNADRKPPLNWFAELSVITAMSFPLILLATFHREYLVNPWEMIPFRFFRCWLLLPILAVVSGHIAGARIKRSAARGVWFKRVGLLIGYLSILAFPIITARYGHPIYEASAVGSLRSIREAAAAYEQAHPQKGFPVSLEQLSPHKYEIPDCAWCLDDALSAGKKSAYRFTYVPRTEGSIVTAYQVYADPLQPRNPYTRRHFFIDQTGTIRIEDNVPANPHSKTLQ